MGEVVEGEEDVGLDVVAVTVVVVVVDNGDGVLVEFLMRGKPNEKKVNHLIIYGSFVILMSQILTANMLFSINDQL